MDARENTATLLRLVNGYYVSQAIHVAASLGIADLLAGGARTSDDLAEAAGADASSRMRQAPIRRRSTDSCAHSRAWASCMRAMAGSFH